MAGLDWEVEVLDMFTLFPAGAEVSAARQLQDFEYKYNKVRKLPLQTIDEIPVVDAEGRALFEEHIELHSMQGKIARSRR